MKKTCGCWNHKTDADWKKFHENIHQDRNCNRNFTGINIYIYSEGDIINLKKKKKRLKHWISLILVIFLIE